MSSVDSAPVIHVLHENPDWFRPFQAAFEAAGVPYREWLLVDGVLDLDEAPPAGIEVAGIEFIETADGRIVTYDVNTNINYNAQIEASAPHSGAGAIVDYLAALLADAYLSAR